MFPQTFHAAVMSLGKNDKERAQVLGMNVSSLQKLRRGLFPPNLRALMRQPKLMTALAADAEALAAQKSVPAEQPTTPDSVGEGA